VVNYGDGIHVAQDFSDDSDRLEATLRGLKARGDSARLNDTLAQAIAMLEKEPKGKRRVIVAFSDGIDLGSEASKDQIVQRATSAEVTIYGLGFSVARELWAKKPDPHRLSPLDTNVTRPLPNTPRTPTNSDAVYNTPMPVVPILVATGEIIRSALASNLLEYYAGYTGGVYYSHWVKKNLQDQLNRIATEIQSQYDIAYIPDTLSQSGFHRVEVEVQRRGVKVRTRAGYFYQGPNPQPDGRP
jgi:VWFA-related protein